MIKDIAKTVIDITRIMHRKRIIKKLNKKEEKIFRITQDPGNPKRNKYSNTELRIMEDKRRGIVTYSNACYSESKLIGRRLIERLGWKED